MFEGRKVKAVVLDVGGVIRDSKRGMNLAHERAWKIIMDSEYPLKGKDREAWWIFALALALQRHSFFKGWARDYATFFGLLLAEDVSRGKRIEEICEKRDSLLLGNLTALSPNEREMAKRMGEISKGLLARDREIMKEITVREDGRKLVRILEKKGKPLFLLSASPKENLKKWIEENLVGFKGEILGNIQETEIGLRKIAKRIGATEEEPLAYIGDTVADLEAVKKVVEELGEIVIFLAVKGGMEHPYRLERACGGIGVFNSPLEIADVII